MKVSLAVAVAAVISSASALKVIEATDKDLATYLSNGKPSVVDFFAPWCGHCKNLAPIYDELAESFGDIEELQLIKVDVDANNKIATKYSVEYLPDVRFFDHKGEEVEAVKARTLEGLTDYIKDKVSSPELVNALKKRKALEHAKFLTERANKVSFEEITESNWDEQVMHPDRAALVAFTTTWCGHCKTLKPEFEKLAGVFAKDKDVVIGVVDCTDGNPLCDKYEVKGYPTIYLFAKGDAKKPAPYGGRNRQVEGFVEWLQFAALTERKADGSLIDTAGRVPDVDNMLQVNDNYEMIAENIAQGAEYNPNIKIYLRIFDKIAKEGQEYVIKELQRVTKILETGKVAPARLEAMTRKLHVLQAFREAMDQIAAGESPAHEEL